MFKIGKTGLSGVKRDVYKHPKLDISGVNSQTYRKMMVDYKHPYLPRKKITLYFEAQTHLKNNIIIDDTTKPMSISVKVNQEWINKFIITDYIAKTDDGFLKKVKSTLKGDMLSKKLKTLKKFKEISK